MKYIKRIALIFFAVCWMASCKKDTLLTDSSAKLDFSTDTVMFDTVFTSLGSTTKQLKIYNNNNQPLKISSIILAGGQNSTYRLNVDGIEGKSFTDVEIPAKDSLFIFVEVTVNPNNTQTPFILQDSIVFITNGNQQDVKLVAFGQNAHFIIADRVIKSGDSYIHYALLDTGLNSTITWDNSIPYVIYGGYAVVDSSQTLIVQPGTRIYFANNSGLWVYRYGTIKAQGTESQPINFQGIRLESYYQDVAGQWDRIWINEGSTDNIIDHAIIKNGFIGIQSESLLDSAPPKKLVILNTVIQNMSGFGILARYYNLDVKNSVVARCGQYALALTQGGGYEFRHCTIANYWNDSQRSTPSIRLDDYAENQAGVKFNYPLYKADFLNCIIWGNNEEELEIDYQFASNNHQFRNVLLKTQLDVSTPNFSSIILNQDPDFFDRSVNDYSLMPGSVARNAGDVNFIDTDTQNDITGFDRMANPPPDLGAFEYH